MEEVKRSLYHKKSNKKKLLMKKYQYEFQLVICNKIIVLHFYGIQFTIDKLADYQYQMDCLMTGISKTALN